MNPPTSPTWDPFFAAGLLTGSMSPKDLRYLLSNHSQDEYTSASDETLASWRVPRIHPRPLDLDRDTQILLLGSQNYPELLATVASPPPVLFVRGSLEALHPGLAVVGSRTDTPFGRRVTASAVYALAGTTTPVISGLALGIDAWAHRVALDAHLPTIAVLATHPTSPTPLTNAALASEILESGGVLLSEQPPDVTVPIAQNLMARNRIIVALSRLVVVAECARRSGTMGAVAYACRYDRPVAVATPSDTNRDLPTAAGPVALAGSIDQLPELSLPHDVTQRLRARGRIANHIAASPRELAHLVATYF